ncbi:prepilin-type N-terminal cleavage/methylation domain-containing protein [Opitutaceae bacterium TAV1]|nr:prepilin-type N-terminal cleavage/methylation domain-containing protein [Opitutaceae bacterium TAV1]
MNNQLQTARRTRRSRAAFTLIELLTVIAIMGILAAIMIPTVGAVRKTAQGATCTSNLRQITAAALLYASENKDWLPPRDTGGSAVTYWPVWLLEGTMKTPAINGVLLCPAIYVEGNQSQMTKSTQTGVARPFSYAVNVRIVGNYDASKPGNYNGYNGRRWKLSEIKTPSRTSLYAECHNVGSSGVDKGGGYIRDYRNKVSGECFPYPHREANMIAFADGHVRALKKEQIPDDDTDVFWTGDVTR